MNFHKFTKMFYIQKFWKEYLLFSISCIIFYLTEIFLFYLISIIFSSKELIQVSNLQYLVLVIVFLFSFLINRKILFDIPAKIGIELSDDIFKVNVSEQSSAREDIVGNKYALIIDEIKRFCHAVVTPLLQIVQRMVIIILYMFLGIYLFGFDVLYAIILAAPFIMVMIFQRNAAKKIDKGISISQKFRSNIVSTFFSDTLHLKSYYPLNNVLDKFNLESKSFYKNYAKGSFIVETQRLIFDLLIFMIVFLLIVNSENSNSSTYFFVLLMMMRAGPQVLAILSSYTLMAISITSFEELASFKEKNHVHAHETDEISLIKSFSIKLISGNQYTFYQGINLITGASGSGKTTILEDLFCSSKRMLDKIYINHKDLDTLIPGSAIFLSARPKLISGSGSLNLFNSSIDKEKFIFFLYQFKLIPDQSETDFNNLFRYADKPSLGQAQRISIARALSSKNQIIAIDETFSGLDDEIQEKVISSLENSGKYVLVATHDTRLINKYSTAINLS